MKKKLKPGIKRKRMLSKKSPSLIGAFKAGTSCSYKVKEVNGKVFVNELNHNWAHWFLAKKIKCVRWKAYCRAAQRFNNGYSGKAHRKLPASLIMLPTQKKVAVILSVINEEKTVSLILDQLNRLPLAEVIVVVNGSVDGTFSKVYKHPVMPIILYYDAAIGFDVGRAIGAKTSQSDILVFIDGDMVISAEKLLPFVYAIERGADIALNKISSFMPNFYRRDTVSIIKEFVNRVTGRSDLKTNSLTAVPHALSRKACEVIGYNRIAIPPLAQVTAIQNGLKITAPYGVNVIKRNSLKSTNTGEGNIVEQMILGDNLEALQDLMRIQGDRLKMPDKLRQRQTMGGQTHGGN